MKKGMRMRNAMAMIELIFAIVIISISIMTIPSIMNIAEESTKRMLIDEDAMVRLSAQVMDKFQARWDRGYDVNVSQIPMSYISAISTTADLSCSRLVGASSYRINPDSKTECNLTQAPAAYPLVAGDGNVSRGIEQLNGGTETINITASTGEVFGISANYNVDYVDSTVVMNGNTATAIWRLGSSGNMNPSPAGTRTHLKRIVVRFFDNNLGVDSTLTFFKSNKGSE